MKTSFIEYEFTEYIHRDGLGLIFNKSDFHFKLLLAGISYETQGNVEPNQTTDKRFILLLF